MRSGFKLWAALGELPSTSWAFFTIKPREDADKGSAGDTYGQDEPLADKLDAHDDDVVADDPERTAASWDFGGGVQGVGKPTESQRQIQAARSAVHGARLMSIRPTTRPKRC